MNYTQRILFTQSSLSNALASVRGLYDLSTESISNEVFKQISDLAAGQVTPTAIWCGRAGLYQSRLAAAANGEQLIALALAFRGLKQDEQPDLDEAERVMTPQGASK